MFWNKKIVMHIFAIVILLIVLKGCVVLSFHPLYNNEDLKETHILLGNWVDEDGVMWNFTHAIKKEIINKKKYNLRLFNEKDSTDGSIMNVHIVELEGELFLDFYLEELGPIQKKRSPFELNDLHLLPVHTFAKLEFTEDSMHIRWFNPQYVRKQIEAGMENVRSVENRDYVLLTASPKELQAFVLRNYKNEQAYDFEIKLNKQ